MVEATAQQCHLASHPEGLTCRAGAVVAVVCLRTGAEIRLSSVKS
jgi:hypothetical protein